MSSEIYCEMCTALVELDECGVFTYDRNTLLLCDECGGYIRNLIEACDGE